MDNVGAVLDACVLFPMYLRDTLLSTAEAGLYLPYWSHKILDEAVGNIVSTGKMSAEKAMKLEEIIKKAFPGAMVEVPVGLADVMANHPKDRHVLAAAVAAKADVIVTDNLKDFPPKALAPWNIKVQSPDDFLSDLFDEYPDEVAQVIQRQVNKYKKTKKDVLELLDFYVKNNVISTFASHLLFYQYSEEVVKTVKKALNKCGRSAPEGGQFLEGEKYRLWQQGQTLTVIAKDSRGEILRVQDSEIMGELSPADVKAFQAFQKFALILD
ncbi:PIN domain-containing protein [Microcoleus sp. FACHB-672]|uniref:PIN domain-containing protein n=1 Tax=Microcoleus sp. FACHB-672 TaxID=2692825 RepID=UPI001683A671|nr:PIN domain-containing protein [Microcoleus sp. FACHB-672]MBD2039611.1 PIN domain-containing protein [Microcoleus sp. FACHB-672]